MCIYTCIWVCKLYTENKASIRYSGWSKATLHMLEGLTCIFIYLVNVRLEQFAYILLQTDIVCCCIE